MGRGTCNQSEFDPLGIHGREVGAAPQDFLLVPTSTLSCTCAHMCAVHIIIMHEQM